MSPVKNAAAGIDILGRLRRHRDLLEQMSRREIQSLYAGQILGMWWAVGHPVFLMGMYLFIFAAVFRVKIGGTVDLPLDYATYLLAGLVPWLSFQQVMSRAASVLSSNSNLIKQVVFPIEVLPASSVCVSFVSQIIGTVVLTFYVGAKYRGLPPTYLLVPLLLVFQVCAMLGAAYLIASVSVFFRDVKDIVQMFSTVGVFLMPIFYLPQWVPPLFKPILYVNPFSYMGWCFQDAMYYGRFEHPWAWVVFGLGSLLTLTGGYRLYGWLKPHFGNAL